MTEHKLCPDAATSVMFINAVMVRIGGQWHFYSGCNGHTALDDAIICHDKLKHVHEDVCRAVRRAYSNLEEVRVFILKETMTHEILDL